MKILVVYVARQSFTRTDIEILRSKHEIREVRVGRDSFPGLIASIARSARETMWADVVFAWFGSFHALVPFLVGRLLGRLCVVVCGGYDVDAVPEIGYGNMLPGFRRRIGRAVFSLAHAVVPFSRSAARAAIDNAGARPDKLRMIYLGIERPSAYGRVREAPRLGAITVAHVYRSNLLRKGLATFVQAARFAPEIPFTVIGKWEDDSIDDLRQQAAANVEFTGALSDDQLSLRMEAARVYVQVSAHEGFGRSLAEAMLRGCVPVLTDRGSLREIAGDDGFYVPVRDPQATANAIREAVRAGDATGERARMRVSTLFSVERRRAALLDTLDELFRNRRLIPQPGDAPAGEP